MGHSCIGIKFYRFWNLYLSYFKISQLKISSVIDFEVQSLDFL